jgi:hypothetical protein
VCIIRVEMRPERLHYVVRTVRNLDRNLYSARSDTPHPCADADEVIRITWDFLRSLEREARRPSQATPGREGW